MSGAKPGFRHSSAHIVNLNIPNRSNLNNAFNGGQAIAQVTQKIQETTYQPQTLDRYEKIIPNGLEIRIDCFCKYPVLLWVQRECLLEAE